MSAHTPGPWLVAGGGYERKSADGSPWRSTLISLENGVSIAEVCIPKGESWKHAESLANASLIAAAPDLLAALQAVVDRYAPTWAPADNAINQMWNDARAALAKV